MKKWILLFLFLFGCQSAEKIIIKAEEPMTKAASQWEQSEKIPIPESFLLPVSFVPQAPFANWDVHNDSCEEAGILLAHYYHQNLVLDAATADEELKGMIDYQVRKNGMQEDIFGEGISELAREYYGYNPRILEVNIDRIREEIFSGNPVILMTTAAYLKPEKNDYPEMGYHIVLAVGYNPQGIITHDVGTITGKNTFYSNQTILNAIADYSNQAVVLK